MIQRKLTCRKLAIKVDTYLKLFANTIEHRTCLEQSQLIIIPVFEHRNAAQTREENDARPDP